MNHLLLIIFDSLRYDAVRAAGGTWSSRISRLERRFSYASWTAPSHLNFLMGIMPHSAPKRAFSTNQFLVDCQLWPSRLGTRAIPGEKWVPEISLPHTLKSLGYETHAIVSMPVLNPSTVLAAHFDSFTLMPSHNDFDGIVERLDFSGAKPKFYLINAGETHYPYEIGKGPPSKKLPHIRGAHGAFKWQGSEFAAGPSRFFTPKEMRELKHRQIQCFEHLDGRLPRLYDKCPDNTYLILTSDHGELFGEDDAFGHGPVLHRKVFEVPYFEGLVPR